jgi:6,7-dimethyl-8-ribityllumazine synthase
MSDRYETPSWDDEPVDLGTPAPVAPSSVTPEPGGQQQALGEDAPADLDASSENVLDGWPVAEPTAAEDDDAGDDELDPAAAAPAGPATPVEPGAAAEPAAEPAVPLADHLSSVSEHAPGDLTVPPGYSILEGVATGERRSVGIVVSRFNGDVTTRLLESALTELDGRGVARESITVMPVPGAFELPLAAMALAKTRRFACVVALGCVIRGDTPHFDYVSSEAASGLQLAAIETGVPVAFGVLTLDRADQAESRVTKGAEAVRTGLEMADLFANLRAAAAR